MKMINELIQDKTAVVGIIGLGYVGIPLRCRLQMRAFE